MPLPDPRHPNTGKQRIVMLNHAKVRSIMKEKNIAVPELAQSYGVSKQHMKSIVSGAIEKGGNTIPRLAVALGVTPESISIFF